MLAIAICLYNENANHDSCYDCFIANVSGVIILFNFDFNSDLII